MYVLHITYYVYTYIYICSKVMYMTGDVCGEALEIEFTFQY